MRACPIDTFQAPMWTATPNQDLQPTAAGEIIGRRGLKSDVRRTQNGSGAGMTEAEEDARRKAVAKEIFDAQSKLYGVLYDKATAYTNLLMGAGFAAYFGVWSLVRPFLTRRQTLLAAVLMLLSLAAFVFFELWKGVVTGVATQRRAKGLFGQDGESESDPERFIAKIQAFENANTADALRFSRVWPWAWGASVLFGLAGFCVLLTSLLWQLTH